MLAPIQSRRMRVPILKATGLIVGFDRMGIIVEDGKGRQTMYVCCSRETEFAAKKNSRRGSRNEVLYSDFRVGDKVDVYYEAMEKKVAKLRLVQSAPAQQLRAEAQ